MNIEARKVQLIERITQVDNPSTLDLIHAILEQNDSDFYEELSEVQINSILKGLSEVKSGDTISHDEVKKTYQKWL